jgi:DNA-binding transcriptional MerR regulator
MLISNFARLGQVSVRRLRHYDAIGLLVPDIVDPFSGYRSYSPEQLLVLNRLVALQDLGFNLGQVRRLLAEPVAVDELREMLRLRRVELEEEARKVEARMAAVESRLRMIEQENLLLPDYVVKTIPAVRLVARVATIDPGGPSGQVEAMFEAVGRTLRHIPGSLATPIATYSASEGGMEVVVGYVYSDEPPEGVEVVDLPQAEAVCGVHLGPMSQIAESWQALHRWIAQNHYSYAGPSRELYVRAEAEDQVDWVTELQQPVTRQRCA